MNWFASLYKGVTGSGPASCFTRWFHCSGNTPKILVGWREKKTGWFCFLPAFGKLTKFVIWLTRVAGGIFTMAICQCCWGAPWRKPTRLLSTSTEVKPWGHTEWPERGPWLSLFAVATWGEARHKFRVPDHRNWCLSTSFGRRHRLGQYRAHFQTTATRRGHLWRGQKDGPNGKESKGGFHRQGSLEMRKQRRIP